MTIETAHEKLAFAAPFPAAESREATAGRLGYLSGSPRVSTRADAETTGARAHILGTIGGFEAHGWRVERYVVGDMVPRAWTRKGSQQAISKSLPRRLAADAARIVLARRNARRAHRALAGRVDLVYERFGAFQALGAAFRRDGVPWILETNGPLFHEAKVERRSLALSGLAKRMERAAYRDCDLLVCVSDDLREIIVDACGVSRDKVVVIPNGVDTAFHDPASYAPRRLFPGFTVGFVGNLYAWAAVDLLLDAVADLRREGVAVHVTVVGDGLTRERLEAQVRALELGDRIAFVGRVERAEVPPYVAGFDVGYSGQVSSQLGRMYHSPLKIYEYLAMATPVVASAFADARRATGDGATGWLFAPGDRAGLVAALRRAHEAHAAGDVLPRMGRLARETVVAHHGWPARVEMLIERARQLLPGRLPPGGAG